jgi:hypothetical protein
VSAPEECAQNWYPASQVGWFTAHIREGIAVTGHQLELLQPGLARPGRLDDATVAPIVRRLSMYEVLCTDARSPVHTARTDAVE